MIRATGIDIIEVARIQGLLDGHRDRFLAKVFTRAEQDYCETKANPAESYAARYAAKEAVMKCLGSGWGDGVGFAQIEVQRAAKGSVSIALRERAAQIAAQQGIRRIHLSISHDKGRAIAVAIAED